MTQEEMFNKFKELALKLESMGRFIQNDFGQLEKDGHLQGDSIPLAISDFTDISNKLVQEITSLNSEVVSLLESVDSHLKGEATRHYVDQDR